MALTINNNLMSLTAANYLTASYNSLQKSIESLSSGLRINDSSDDAAGLAIRELFRSDVAVLNQGVRNANDAISMLQTMDGAAGVIDEKLIRMKELAEQAATGTYSSEQRAIMNDEFAEMRNEIDRIAQATDFNSIKMLQTGSAGAATQLDLAGDINLNSSAGMAATSYWSNFSSGDSVTVRVTDHDGELQTSSISLTDGGTTVESIVNVVDALSSVNATYAADNLELTDASAGSSSLDVELISGGDSYDATVTTEGTEGQHKIHFGTGNDSAEDYYYVNNQDLTPSGLNVDSLSIATQDSAQAAITGLDSAIVDKDQARAHFGAMMNRLENTVTNLTIQSENIQAAESQISDVDVAMEMTNFLNTQIKSQAAVAMLAQANMVPQMAMTLLGG